jgi:hypothetical protein
VSLLKQKKDKEMMIQNSAVHFTSIIIKDIVDQEVLNLATAEVRLGHSFIQTNQTTLRVGLLLSLDRELK